MLILAFYVFVDFPFLPVGVYRTPCSCTQRELPAGPITCEVSERIPGEGNSTQTHSCMPSEHPIAT